MLPESACASSGVLLLGVSCPLLRSTATYQQVIPLPRLSVSREPQLTTNIPVLPMRHPEPEQTDPRAIQQTTPELEQEDRCHPRVFATSVGRAKANTPIKLLLMQVS